MRIELRQLNATRLYAALATVLPICIGVGLFMLGGVIGKVGALLCGVLAFQSIRANLGFARALERVGDRVLVHPLWSGSVRTHHDLQSVDVRLAITGAPRQPRIRTEGYILRFADGPVLVRSSAFPGAAELVASLIRETSPDVEFPLELGQAAMHHWLRLPDASSLGVSAAYLHGDGTRMTIYVYGAEGDRRRVDVSKVGDELDRSLANIGVICKKSHVPFRLLDRGEASMAGLEFLSASLVEGRGRRARKSQIFLTVRDGLFFKVRVTSDPDNDAAIAVVEPTLEAFLREH